MASPTPYTVLVGAPDLSPAERALAQAWHQQTGHAMTAFHAARMLREGWTGALVERLAGIAAVAAEHQTPAYQHWRADPVGPLHFFSRLPVWMTGLERAGMPVPAAADWAALIALSPHPGEQQRVLAWVDAGQSHLLDLSGAAVADLRWAYAADLSAAEAASAWRTGSLDIPAMQTLAALRGYPVALLTTVGQTTNHPTERAAEEQAAGR